MLKYHFTLAKFRWPKRPLLRLWLYSSRGGFVGHSSLTLVAKRSVTKIISLTCVIMVTPKPN